jgi:hypothetical protein
MADATKEEKLVLEGTIVEALPNTSFKVKLENWVIESASSFRPTIWTGDGLFIATKVANQLNIQNKNSKKINAIVLILW